MAGRSHIPRDSKNPIAPPLHPGKDSQKLKVEWQHLGEDLESPLVVAMYICRGIEKPAGR